MKIKKQAKTESREVAPVEVVTPTVEKSDRELVQQINKDMMLGDLGEFCRKRAGVGLCAIRSFHAHGEWEKRLMELFPAKSLRTLRRYVNAGEEVCRRFEASPHKIYDLLMHMDTERIRLQADIDAKERKLLPVRGVSKDMALENRLFNYVVAITAGEKEQAPTPKAQKTTPEQEAAERRAQVEGYANSLRNWSGDRKALRLLEADALETFAAELTLVVNVIRKELRERETHQSK